MEVEETKLHESDKRHLLRPGGIGLVHRIGQGSYRELTRHPRSANSPLIKGVQTASFLGTYGSNSSMKGLGQMMRR